MPLADAAELPPRRRAVIDAADEVYVVTPACRDDCVAWPLS
jgi:hypothetical protein